MEKVRMLNDLRSKYGLEVMKMRCPKCVELKKAREKAEREKRIKKL